MIEPLQSNKKEISETRTFDLNHNEEKVPEFKPYSNLNKMRKMNENRIEDKDEMKPDIDQEKLECNNTKQYHCFLGTFQTELYWGNLVAIFSLHFATLYFVFVETILTEGLFMFGLIVGILGGFGVTGGAHRYWTHRCFKAKLPLKIILLICYSIAGQNSILEWVRDHRVHHKFSETDADPHNSKRGFIFSHVGWLCMKKHPEVYSKGKTIDISDISSDPILAFHTRHWMWFKLLFCFVIPSVIPPYCFGISWRTSIIGNCIVRYCIQLNSTWSVNSFAHMWGNKPYNRNIRPVENKYVSFIALGEGWHNYHHTFPWDYRAAELGASFNLTTIFLDFFAKVGWAYDLKTTSPELIEKVIHHNGDGTHYSNRQIQCSYSEYYSKNKINY